MNFTTVLAITLGVLMVFVTQKLDGGSLSSLIQPSAFFIVVGGTFCAAFLNFPHQTILKAFDKAKEIFVKEDDKTIQLLSEIVQIAQYARINGLLATQNLIPEIQDTFLARGLHLAIDFNNPQMLNEILTSEIAYEEEQELIYSRVFEALGGYAPTFGVVGAVMGLIHVMRNMSDLELLGSGIATAFIATLYGVGFANLILLPIAGNLKQRTREKILLKELVLQGILSIMMQENPIIIEEKLIAYLKYHNKTQVIAG